MKTSCSSTMITILLVCCCALVTLAQRSEMVPECPEIRSDYFNLLTQDELRLMCLMKSRIVFGGKMEEEREGEEGKEEEEGGSNQNQHLPTDDELRDLFHVDNTEDELLRQEQLHQAEVQESLLRRRDEDNTLAHNILAQMMTSSTTMQQKQQQQQQQQEEQQLLLAPHQAWEEKAAFGPGQDIILDYYQF